MERLNSPRCPPRRTAGAQRRRRHLRL